MSWTYVPNNVIVGPFSSGVGLTTTTASSYSGPGDVISGATAWWGLRAYSAAKAAALTPLIDVVKTADGTGGGTINCLANGSLDVATIAAFGYGVSVSKIYDQTGNGFDQVVFGAVLAKMPVLTLAGLGSLPCMTFTPTNTFETGAVGSFNQPVTLSCVANSTNNGAQQCILQINAVASHEFGYNNSGAGNQVFLYDGAVLGATASDGAWHTLQAVFNGASSDMNVDGGPNVGNGGSTNPGSITKIQLGTTQGTNEPFSGKFVEGGFWASAFSGAQSTAMDANQSAYWGI